MPKRLLTIATELKMHAPFTLFGAATGIICMLLFRNAGQELNQRFFLVFHPTHVVLSAIVTTSLFKLYEKKASIVKILVIGYVGSIGVATLSDCVLPFFGENILGVAIPVHSHQNEHDQKTSLGGQEEHAHTEDVEQDHEHIGESGPNSPARSAWHRLHLGFIEDWYVVNPAALLGILIAYFWPRTKFPHAGHVLISTWASSFHVLMNTQREFSAAMLLGAFIVLFIAVWLPCCISDIVFPLLFIKSAPLHLHGHHVEETSS